MLMHPGLDKLERSLLAAGGERQRQILWEGIFALSGFVLTGLFVFFLIDYLTRVPYVVRLLIFLSGLGYGFYWFYRCFYLPYRKEYDTQSVALLLEKEQPELQSRLISTLQFQHVKQLAPGVSANLVDGLVEQTFDKFTKKLDTGAIINRQWVKKRSLVLSGAVVVWAALLVLAPAVGIAYFMRLALPDSIADYPRNTHIIDISIPEIMAEGEEYTLTVKATGKLPEIGIVDLDPEVGDRLRQDLVPVKPVKSPEPETPEKTESGEKDAEPKTPENPETPATERTGVYEVKMPPLLCPAKLSVVVGDDQRYGISLRPEKRPSLRSVAMHVDPPAYTGEKPYDLDTGTAQMPVGSRFSVAIEPSKKLKKFEVIAQGTGERIPAKMDKDGKITFSMTAEKQFAYTIAMTDTVGLALKDAPLYTIGVIADRTPLVRIVKPVGAAEMAPRSRLPIEFEVRDDYKISSVSVKYQVYDAKDVDNDTSGNDPFADRSRPRPETFFEKNDINQPLFSYNEEWNNNDGAILPGKIVRMWVEAVDNNKNTTLSADIFIRIITEAEYRNLLLKKLAEQMEGSEGILLDVKGSIKSMEQIRKQNNKIEKKGN